MKPVCLGTSINEVRLLNKMDRVYSGLVKMINQEKEAGLLDQIQLEIHKNRKIER